MFHPQVDSKSGEMNVKRDFPEWRKGLHLWQVLEFMRTAFYILDTKEPANEECTEMLVKLFVTPILARFVTSFNVERYFIIILIFRYKNNPELFTEKVKLCVKNSQDHLYDPPPVDDPHYLRFDPYDREKHEPVRESIMNPKVLVFFNWIFTSLIFLIFFCFYYVGWI